MAIVHLNVSAMTAGAVVAEAAAAAATVVVAFGEAGTILAWLTGTMIPCGLGSS